MVSSNGDWPKSGMPQKYTFVRHLTDVGGCNSGIFVVLETKTGKPFVEKQFTKLMIREGHAYHEIEILKQLRGHPYIVEMADSFLDRSVFLENCRYGSMRDLIARHRPGKAWISEKWIWKTFYQVAQAVHFMHHGPTDLLADSPPWKAILHLDIKPDNILLIPGKDKISDLDVKVCDFGSAFGGEHGAPGSGARTGYFEPPERDISTAVDVWCLGKTIQCLSRLEQIPIGIVAEPITGYSRNLRAIIDACTRKEARERVASEELPEVVRSDIEQVKDVVLIGAAPILPSLF